MLRERLRAGRALVQLIALIRLPPRVAAFYARSLRLAHRSRDHASLDIAARPVELAPILRAAAGARRVAEVGTGTAWTAIALTLADRRRTVVSVDPVARPERERYLELMKPADRERLTLLTQPGEAGPPGDEPIDFLFIDSSHEREETIETFGLWSPLVAPGGAIAFHDYGNERYPGVEEAVAELGLEGKASHHMFTYRKP